MRKLIVAVTGGTLLLLGVAMIALPGPAIVVIPAALAILATEFMWARHALHKCKSAVGAVPRKLRWRWWPRCARVKTARAACPGGRLSPRAGLRRLSP